LDVVGAGRRLLWVAQRLGVGDAACACTRGMRRLGGVPAPPFVGVARACNDCVRSARVDVGEPALSWRVPVAVGLLAVGLLVRVQFPFCVSSCSVVVERAACLVASGIVRLHGRSARPSRVCSGSTVCPLQRDVQTSSIIYPVFSAVAHCLAWRSPYAPRPPVHKHEKRGHTKGLAQLAVAADSSVDAAIRGVPPPASISPLRSHPPPPPTATRDRGAATARLMCFPHSA